MTMLHTFVRREKQLCIGTVRAASGLAAHGAGKGWSNSAALPGAGDADAGSLPAEGPHLDLPGQSVILASLAECTA